jgi:hypothetical protein
VLFVYGSEIKKRVKKRVRSERERERIGKSGALVNKSEDVGGTSIHSSR